MFEKFYNFAVDYPNTQNNFGVQPYYNGFPFDSRRYSFNGNPNYAVAPSNDVAYQPNNMAVPSNNLAYQPNNVNTPGKFY